MYPLPIYSAKDTAITQRPTSTSLLCIDSEDRFRDYDDARSVLAGLLNRSPYNFAINKTQSLMNGFFTRVGVSEIVFPWVIPNINVRTSQMNVEYDVGAGPVDDVIDLEIGFYTPSMIAAEIQRQVRLLDAGLAAFTMTYGVDTTGAVPTQRPIFEYKTNAPGVEIAFSPQSAATAPNRQSKQLFDILGFTVANEILDTAEQGTNTYCQATRYIDIVCTQLTANQALKDTMSQVVARDVLCRVYVGDAQGVQSTVLPSASTFCPPGCMPTTVYKNFANPKQIQWMPNQPVPGYLQFRVYDDAGDALENIVPGEVGNGANWSMTLLVSEN